MGHPLFKAGCTIDYSFVAFFTCFMVDFRIFVSFVLYLRNECYFFVILTPLRLQFSGEWMLQKRLPTLQVKQSFVNVGMIRSQYNSKYFSIDFLRYRTIFNFKLIIQYGYDIIFLTL